MKKLLTTCFLFAFVILGAQVTSIQGFEDEQGEIILDSQKRNNDVPQITINETFSDAADKHNVPYRSIQSITNQEDGYYAIVGVFSDTKNLSKVVADLQRRGFNAGTISNLEDELNYVYLQYYPFGLEAIDAYITEFNGQYTDESWILEVGENSDSVDVVELEEDNASTTEIATASETATTTYRTSTTESSTALDNTSDVAETATATFDTAETEIANAKDAASTTFNTGATEIANTKDAANTTFDTGVTEIAKTTDTAETIFNTDTVDSSTTLDKATDEVQSVTQDIGNLASLDEVKDTELSSSQTTDQSLSLDSINYQELNESEETSTNGVKIEESTKKSKLIKKADAYFDLMWYAEAAELYEQALAKNEKNHSFDVIQKVADSHYFNTNMEQAYTWYNVLYDNYGEELSADNIFKYAHSLKGTGKYARSKRLMRLYNKKLEKGDIASSDNLNFRTPNEVVLDNLLESKSNFELQNLSINSEYSEFSPMFLDSNQVVYASAKDSSFLNTRRYKWNDQPYLDLYVAKVNEESQDLKDAIKFSKTLNTKYHEASVTFSPDNTTMYFTRNNYGKKLKRDKNGVNHLKIYMSNKVGDEWSDAVEVPFNSDDYSTGHPALSPDGKQMYFVSDMPGTIGETDLFVVDVLEGNSFSEPRNLGPKINTERKEMFPFINDKKLYFSSNGHTGLGGLDVYEVSYTEEEGFEEPINVGQPINSNKDDFSYIVNEENQKGYFASNRENGKGDDDIYSFKRLVVEETPAANSAIAGVVVEMVTGDIMPRALVELLDENGIKLKEMESEDDGSFIFEDLDADTKYTIKATKDEYFENIQEVTTVANDTVDVELSMKKLVEMIAIEDGIKKLKTEMIFFDFDKSYIRQDASVELDKLVEVMNEYPNMIIRIESHTDSRGTREYNNYLSDRRAKSTRDYIIAQGISAGRIESAIGYGEERLLNGCDGTVRCTEEEHYANRRSEFIIVNM